LLLVFRKKTVVIKGLALSLVAEDVRLFGRKWGLQRQEGRTAAAPAQGSTPA
jgi:hypothetical protein